MPGGYFIGTIVNQEFAEENPEIVTKVTNAILRAQKWILENPAEAREIAVGLLPESTPEVIDGVRDVTDLLAADQEDSGKRLGLDEPRDLADDD